MGTRDSVVTNGPGGGEEVGALLEAMSGDLDAGLIPARVTNDPEIHQRELDNLFTNAWVFIGHETEVPTPGDYVTRYIGNDPFILVRDERGTVRVLFNACRHRGTQVCRSEKGNSSHFRCPYHGWTYKNSGELAGMPAFQEAYGNFDKSGWGLLSAPKVESVYGMVFASLAPSAPSLSEYLGDMMWYLDLLFGLTEGGMEVIGEPQRWRISANWKSGAENFAGDDYHILFLHKSTWEVGLMTVHPPTLALQGYHVQARNGHTFAISAQPGVQKPDFPGYPPDLIAQFRRNGLTDEQFSLAGTARIMLGNIFPNLSFAATPVSPDPAHIEAPMFTMLRLWQPVAPNVTELWNWVLAYKEASDEFKERSYRGAVANLGSAGYFEQDDSVPWESIARAAGTRFFRDVKLNYQMGLNGIGNCRRVDDWPGPGEVYSPRLEEGAQRTFYREWLRYVRG